MVSFKSFSKRIFPKIFKASGTNLKILAAKQRWESAEIKDDDDMFFSMEPVDDVQTDDNAFRLETNIGDTTLNCSIWSLVDTHSSAAFVFGFDHIRV